MNVEKRWARVEKQWARALSLRLGLEFSSELDPPQNGSEYREYKVLSPTGIVLFHVGGNETLGMVSMPEMYKLDGTPRAQKS
jgi:hypothetical protein